MWERLCPFCDYASSRSTARSGRGRCTFSPGATRRLLLIAGGGQEGATTVAAFAKASRAKGATLVVSDANSVEMISRL